MIPFLENISSQTTEKFRSFSFISWLIIVFGILMLIIWLKEIFQQAKKVKKFPFSWKNENGEWIWFHILTELLTAFLLIVLGILLQLAVPNAVYLTMFSSGLLFYASMNSLSWVFAHKSRFVFIIPMCAGIILSSLILLIVLL